MKTGNIFEAIPAALAAEMCEILASAAGVRIERIVSRGHCSSPGFWYDQDQEEWVMLVKGEAILQFEQGQRSVHLLPGMHVHIAAHERHRVQWTSEGEETIWLAVFY